MINVVQAGQYISGSPFGATRGRHSRMRTFWEIVTESRDDHALMIIFWCPGKCWGTMARAREKKPQVRQCPADGLDTAVETCEIQAEAAHYPKDVGDMMANTKPIFHQQHKGLRHYAAVADTLGDILEKGKLQMREKCENAML